MAPRPTRCEGKDELPFAFLPAPSLPPSLSFALYPLKLHSPGFAVIVLSALSAHPSYPPHFLLVICSPSPPLLHLAFASRGKSPIELVQTSSPRRQNRPRRSLLFLLTLTPFPKPYSIVPALRVSRCVTYRTRTDEFTEAAKPPPAKPFPLHCFHSPLHPIPPPRISPRSLPFFAFFSLSGLKSTGWGVY